MGVSLNYNLIGDVKADTWETIQEEANILAQTRHWWCESINFYGSLNEGIFGDSKVYRTTHTSSTGEQLWVDDNDNKFMSFRDIKFIIETLADWSQRFGVSWELLFLDSPVGKLTPTTKRQSVANIVQEFAAPGTINPESPEGEALAKSIFAKYPR